MTSEAILAAIKALPGTPTAPIAISVSQSMLEQLERLCGKPIAGKDYFLLAGIPIRLIPSYSGDVWCEHFPNYDLLHTAKGTMRINKTKPPSTIELK